MSDFSVTLILYFHGIEMWMNTVCNNKWVLKSSPAGLWLSSWAKIINMQANSD